MIGLESGVDVNHLLEVFGCWCVQACHCGQLILASWGRPTNAEKSCRWVRKFRCRRIRYVSATKVIYLGTGSRDCRAWRQNSFIFSLYKVRVQAVFSHQLSLNANYLEKRTCMWTSLVWDPILLRSQVALVSTGRTTFSHLELLHVIEHWFSK